MKVKIEIDESLQEEEVVIKAPSLNEKVQRIQEVIHDMSKSSKTMIFYKGQVEYYLSLDDILFFETSDHHIHAHTKMICIRLSINCMNLKKCYQETL